MFIIRTPGGGSESVPPPSSPSQKRRSYRASIEFPVVYRVAGRAGTRTAAASDLSTGGLRLLGDEDFAAGAVIELRFTLPAADVANVCIEKEVTERTAFGERTHRVRTPPEPFGTLLISGQAVVAFYDLRTRGFAHGICFLRPPQRTADEIQRFIHLYQLKQLRERALLIQ